MKKNYILALLLGSFAFSNAQTKIKTSGDVVLSSSTSFPLTAKIDLNPTTSIATITVTGPVGKWFAFALDAGSMSDGTPDVIAYTTTLLDYSMSGGYSSPKQDTTNNLTVVSDLVSGDKRTVVATRPFSTGDSKDYTFSASTASINIIWAIGSSTNIGGKHAIRGFGAFDFKDGLGNNDFELSNLVSVSPNPSNGVFSIVNEKMLQINGVKIFDINAKLVKEISFDKSENEYSINASEVASGVYFIEISTATDKFVKKIQINK